MKITKLIVKQIKGVREIEITAHPTVNELAGQNGAGKSTVLDSILWALGGTDEIAPRPIRDGEGEGEIVLETESLEVVRRFREGKTPTLAVRSKDGAKVLKPQTTLDSLFSGFTFDPLAFARQKPTEQAHTLQEILGADFSATLSDLDRQVASAESERKDINREVARVGAIPFVVDPGPDVDIAGVHAALDEIRVWNAEQEHKAVMRQRVADAREGEERALGNLRRDLEALQTKIARQSGAVEALRIRVEELPAPEEKRDPAMLQSQLAKAGAQNRRVAEHRQYKHRLAEHTACVQESVRLDAEVARLREARDRHIREAKLPIEGLALSPSGVRLGGIPFEQLSSSERIRASARIGMALAPTLRIMFIRDGSLLDDQSFAELVTLAEEREYQLWIETVGAGHGDAIVLEEGVVNRKSKSSARATA